MTGSSVQTGSQPTPWLLLLLLLRRLSPYKNFCTFVSGTEENSFVNQVAQPQHSLEPELHGCE